MFLAWKDSNGRLCNAIDMKSAFFQRPVFLMPLPEFQEQKKYGNSKPLSIVFLMPQESGI